MATLEAETAIKTNGENEGKTDEMIKNENLETVCCSLLLVVAEPLNVEQKDLILERIVTELSNWDSELSGCDLSQQVQSILNFQPTAQDGMCFKTIIRDMKVVILIKPTIEVVFEELQSFMQASSKYKYLVHSGPVLMNSGAWMLADATFTFHNFCQVLKRPQVVESLAKNSESLIDLSFVRPSVEWNEAAFKKVNPKLKIRLNRPTQTLSDESGLIKFSDHISTFLTTPSISDRLQSASMSGAITFDQPTAYVFPAGQGNCFLFGVTGFSILIDGGYSKNSCFYNLVRHLGRLDAVIMTRLSPDNILGLSSFFEKQAFGKQNPVLGTVMLNIGDARHKVTPPEGNEQQRTTSGLIVSIAEEGRLMAEYLSLLNLKPTTGLGTSYTNLYYKVGHGSLCMYVINPHLDSKDFNDFLQSWSKAVDSYKGGVPVSDNLSISCVMLWKPALHLKEKMVRMLFPGRISLQRLSDGLDKLNNVMSFQTASGVEKATSKKAASSTKQTGSRLGAKRGDLTAKAPSSASLDKNKDARKVVPVEVKRTAARKPLPVKSVSKATVESTTKDSRDAKTAKGADAKAVRKVEGTTSLSHKTPGKKGIEGGEKKDAKVPYKSPKPADTQAAIVKKSPRPAQQTKLPGAQLKTPAAQKPADKKTPVKTRAPKSVEKPKSNGKQTIPEKKESPASIKSPEKHESTENQTSLEKVEIVGEKKADEIAQVVAEKVDAEAVGCNAVGKDLLSEKEREKADEDKEVEESKPIMPDQIQPVSLKEFDPSKEWDTPLKLPSPSKDTSEEADVKKPLTDARTAKTQRKPMEEVKSASRTGKPETRKAPLKAVTPFHVDLTYIPSHADVDFFRRVRAHYYVLSSPTPDHNILPNLIEARSSWEEAEQGEVCLIPTHQSQVLLTWLATLNDRLMECNIKVTPPASRCSVAISQPHSACDAYRIPFN